MMNDTKTITHNVKQKAVIYARVSSTKQVTQGNGLASQETRCREYAKHKGYGVVEVFTDDMTGSKTTRPGMKAMLVFLRGKRRTHPHVVIIDDISRLARGIEAHLQLRSQIGNAGGLLESPSIEFGEDSDSQLIENLLASVSQHHRQKNAEQTKNRMRARVMNGYWVYQAPIGYQFAQIPGHGKLLVRNEPIASYLQEALESFASGRFQTQAEVKRFLESQPDYPKDLNGRYIRAQRITNILKQPLYAGYIELPNWEISLRKGHHEPLISFQTFQRIQERLTEKAKVPTRKDTTKDFPLRGFIRCSQCEKPLTAGWSKGKNKYYPYYFCQSKVCDSYGKTIRRDRIEGDFEALLKSLKPTGELFNLACAAFKNAWNAKLTQFAEHTNTMRSNIRKTEKQIESLVDRIVDAVSPTAITAYEKRIAKLEADKVLLSERCKNNTQPKGTLRENLEHALAFLANPYRLWSSGRFEDKRTVLKLTFSHQLTYHRDEGYRTPKISLPFKLLEAFKAPKNGMVGPVGLEPTTNRL